MLATHYDGKELNSPNDIVVKSDGRIYFTDPTYGRMEYYGLPREQELDFQGVYRIDEDGGNLTLLADDFAQPNGLVFNCRREPALRRRHRPQPHPRLRRQSRRHAGRRRGLGRGHRRGCQGVPDGLKLDVEGNVYCLRAGRAARFRAPMRPVWG